MLFRTIHIFQYELCGGISKQNESTITLVAAFESNATRSWYTLYERVYPAIWPETNRNEMEQREKSIVRKQIELREIVEVAY